jgi:17 kDa common-antigen outer membrane protein
MHGLLGRTGVLATLLLIVQLSPAFGQNMRFLLNTPVEKFNDEDFARLKAAALTLLDHPSPGAKQSWDNAATGNSGTLTLLQSFSTADGRECHKLHIENRAKALQGASDMNVCRGADRRWLMDPEATPAP